MRICRFLKNTTTDARFHTKPSHHKNNPTIIPAATKQTTNRLNKHRFYRTTNARYQTHTTSSTEHTIPTNYTVQITHYIPDTNACTVFLYSGGIFICSTESQPENCYLKKSKTRMKIVISKKIAPLLHTKLLILEESC